MYNLWHAVWEIGHIIEVLNLRQVLTSNFTFEETYFGKIEEEEEAASSVIETIIAPRKMMMFLRNGLKVSSCDDYSFIAANNEPFGHICTMVCSSLLYFLEEPVNLQS
ncbi:hypothetical protein T07_13923 [Trichinella nelsoni]|uniref:Uncharacterized protein n=1 Tax=Trichinella nelsoni TaxID=6336 RepID=A0A0V0S5Y7_9BILA|nr:hypothetical protein T07_13923 [Trichinella nelsoni]